MNYLFKMSIITLTGVLINAYVGWLALYLFLLSFILLGWLSLLWADYKSRTQRKNNVELE